MNLDSPSPFTAAVDKPAALPPRTNHVRRTMLEAIYVLGFNLVLTLLLYMMNLSFFMPSSGNTQGLERLSKNPLLLLVLGVIVAPLIEELLFRGVPFVLFRAVQRWNGWGEKGRQTLCWTLGGMAAVLFAVAHGIEGTKVHLPLPQLVLGLWSWHVINQRGLRYSILLHATYNSLPVGFMVLAQLAKMHQAS
jgi:membrane protease YdiL (CAAX protease family)